jgi:uncharacterized protein
LAHIFAIGDLHLSFSTEKPMDIFGEQWIDHPKSIQRHWQETVGDEDWVLVPGDLSWAMKLEEAKVDLEWIGKLPGKKIIIRGNHDYWWTTISKVRKSLPPNMFALQNDAMQIGDIAICGTRGWNCPGSHDFDEHDEQIYKREVGRLRLALECAKKLSARIWVMLHYPPTNEKCQPSLFSDLMREYRVEHCIYGHLHGEGHRAALLGEYEGTQYHLVSCDFLHFAPKRIF